MKRCPIPPFKAWSGGYVIIAALLVTSCAGEPASTENQTPVERTVKHFDEKSNTGDRGYNNIENQGDKKSDNHVVDYDDLLRFNSLDDIEILPLEMFHGEDIPMNYFLLEWYGLYVDDEGSELRKAEVEFRPAFDPLLDMTGEMTAKQVVVTNDTLQPILLISGVEEHAGPLPSIEMINDEGTVLSLPHILEPGHDLFLEKGLDSKYILEVHGEGNSSCAIELIRHGEATDRQVIAGAKEMDDARMDVRWVGDLNGDSRPDLLLNIASKYSYAHWALFLSGNEEDRLLLPVADLLFTGC